MKLRSGKNNGEKNTALMSPMIDVVFLLLIFFMLTLKIVPPEGDMNINMPRGAAPPKGDPLMPDLKVRLIADKHGNLAEMKFGNKSLGNDPRQAFELLNQEILGIMGNRRNLLETDSEVEIDADYELDYAYTTKAIGACMGQFDPNSEQVVRYIERIKFAKPRSPKS